MITKIDIMDQGTDAATMLRGEDVPLRLGYVGVKMRSQQDIVNKKPVKDSLKDEKDWFENHRVYSNLAFSTFNWDFFDVPKISKNTKNIQKPTNSGRYQVSFLLALWAPQF